MIPGGEACKTRFFMLDREPSFHMCMLGEDGKVEGIKRTEKKIVPDNALPQVAAYVSFTSCLCPGKLCFEWGSRTEVQRGSSFACIKGIKNG